MAKKRIALLALVAILFNFATVLAVGTETKEYNGVTETLTLSGEFSANGCDGAIYAHDGANLTIEGTGKVHGELCAGTKCGDETCGYAMAVWANKKSTITINGGEYTNDTDTVSSDKNHTDLIYAAGESTITINGGTFKSSTPKWTLNCKNDSNSKIIVKGGRYYQFNPAEADVAPEGSAQEIFVPEGYVVVKDGDWYEVRKLNSNKEYNGVTETLTLSGEFSANGCDGAIYAHDGANLTIEGTGKVHGELCAGTKCGDATCGYAMAVWANKKSTITINGGEYTNDTDTVSSDKEHTDLIYAAGESTITINGGTFKSSTPKWTLNCKNNSNSKIIVKGGRYYQFNPAEADVAPEGSAQEIFVPAEYKVVKDGEWYEVVCAHTTGIAHNKVSATYTETGMESYWECKTCSKIFEDETAKNEITDKNSLIIPKLAEVVENEATITEEAFDTAIEEANKTNESTIVIPVVETEKTIESVVVPVNALNKVIDQDKELTIETSVVNVTMDVEAVKEVVRQAGNAEKVTIEIVEINEDSLNETQKEALKDKKVATILSAKIIANRKNISSFGTGKVTLEIPFELGENEKGTDYTLIYVAEDGTITEVSTNYINGYLVVELEHFSEYAVVKTASVDNTNQPDGEKDSSVVNTGDNIILSISILIVSILGVVIIAKRKSNKK